VKKEPLRKVDDVSSLLRLKHQATRSALRKILVVTLDRKVDVAAGCELPAQHGKAVDAVPLVLNTRG
jgi:hypothetical protein